MKKYGRMDGQLHAFFTADLDVGVWLGSRLARFLCVSAYQDIFMCITGQRNILFEKKKVGGTGSS